MGNQKERESQVPTNSDQKPVANGSEPLWHEKFINTPNTSSAPKSPSWFHASIRSLTNKNYGDSSTRRSK